MLCCSPVSPASHQQPTWWMSTLSTAGQTVSSISLAAFHFLSVSTPPPLPPLCVWLLDSLFLSCYSKLSCTLSILFPSASGQTAQSQWAWVTQDKYIAYNARKLHTSSCMFILLVWWAKHTFINTLGLHILTCRYLLTFLNNINSNKYTWRHRHSAHMNRHTGLSWSDLDLKPKAFWILYRDIRALSF